MPWRERYQMDERLKFVAPLLDGEKMAVLCREFEISRKTGYKIYARYKDCGSRGSPIDPEDPIAMPASCPFRSRRRSCS
jgi:hypothetical protein